MRIRELCSVGSGMTASFGYHLHIRMMPRAAVPDLGIFAPVLVYVFRNGSIALWKSIRSMRSVTKSLCSESQISTGESSYFFSQSS